MVDYMLSIHLNFLYFTFRLHLNVQKHFPPPNPTSATVSTIMLQYVCCKYVNFTTTHIILTICLFYNSCSMKVSFYTQNVQETIMNSEVFKSTCSVVDPVEEAMTKEPLALNMSCYTLNVNSQYVRHTGKM